MTAPLTRIVLTTSNRATLRTATSSPAGRYERLQHARSSLLAAVVPSSEVPGARPPVSLEPLAQSGLVRPAEGAVGLGPPFAHEDGITADAVGTEFLVDQRAGEDLVGRGGGQRRAETDEPGPPLRTEVRLAVQPGRERSAVEGGGGAQDQCSHDLITGVGVRHP